MSDTISIMREGHVVQTGSPRELYDAPVNRYVADFIGQSNFFGGRLVEAGPSGARICTDSGIEIAAPYPGTGSASGLGPGDAVVIGWRQQAGLALADS